jgi:hypothetical protein
MEENNKTSQVEELAKVSTDMDVVEDTSKKIPVEDKKDSDFIGQAIEHPSIKEATKQETSDADKSKPVIIEWKKPFFIMFGIGVLGVVLMYVLKM